MRDPTWKTNISWRVVAFDVNGKRRADFPDRESAEEFFDQERSALADINDKAILYRIKVSGGEKFQDAYKADVLGPEGLIRVRGGASPRTWQEAESRRAKVREGARRSSRRLNRLRYLLPYYEEDSITTGELNRLMDSELSPRELAARMPEFVARRESKAAAWASGDPDVLSEEFESLGDAIHFAREHPKEVDLDGR